MLWRYIFIIFIFFVKTISGLELSDQIDEILKENLAKYGEQISRVKRSPDGKTSTFYREENKVELPICQNMKGILGMFIYLLLVCVYKFISFLSRLCA